MKPKKWAIIVVLVLLCGAMWYWSSNYRDMGQLKQERSSEPILMLNDLNGNKLPVIQQGKITIINFWATWCPGCREEMPELDRFVAKHGKNVGFYAINLQETPEKVKAFMEKNQYKIPVLLDHDGAVGRKFQVNVIPTTIVIDKTGIIKYRHAGNVTVADLEAVLQSL